MLQMTKVVMQYAGITHRLHSHMILRYRSEIAIEVSAWTRQGARELEHQAPKLKSVISITYIVNLPGPLEHT
jgi:hypothetical protein